MDPRAAPPRKGVGVHHIKVIARSLDGLTASKTVTYIVKPRQAKRAVKRVTPPFTG